ncbi:MAG: autotransporter strand-loop-strand O-heptosyltransferase, partial [Alphaproteobacteria bacterium]|nr:autotransporter strand-loop-strand O-heptosyltransferase [Alphaproteobacteria bacterium]
MNVATMPAKTDEPAMAPVGSPATAVSSATAAPAASASAAPEVKPPYPPPAAVPTQRGPLGIRFDFNNGCRLLLPESEDGWRVRLSDLDTGNVIYETSLKGGAINSSKRYYVRFRIDVWQREKLVMSHEYSAKDREILIQFPIGTLGDTMGWFPYAVKFQ